MMNSSYTPVKSHGETMNSSLDIVKKMSKGHQKFLKTAFIIGQSEQDDQGSSGSSLKTDFIIFSDQKLIKFFPNFKKRYFFFSWEGVKLREKRVPVFLWEEYFFKIWKKCHIKLVQKNDEVRFQ